MKTVGIRAGPFVSFGGSVSGCLQKKERVNMLAESELQECAKEIIQLGSSMISRFGVDEGSIIFTRALQDVGGWEQHEAESIARCVAKGYKIQEAC